MQKKFNIEVDCANCAAKIENAVSALPGVNACNVSFMAQKMLLEADDAQFQSVLKRLSRRRKKSSPISRSSCKRKARRGLTRPNAALPPNTPPYIKRCFCMTKKQKKTLWRILVAAVLFVALAVAGQLAALPWYAWLVLYLVPYFIIGHDVLRKAALGVIHGEVFDENFLMAVATVGAMVLGEYGEGVAVMLFYQVGELFQSYAVGKSRRSIAALMDIRPDSANLEAADGTVQTVDPEAVPVGAVIVVRPGEKVPLDGVVLSGQSTLNTSALTGESRPRSARPGGAVLSGSVNGDGLLRVTVSKPYGQSTVARILDLVENSSLKKAKAENFITKFARYYTPAVCFAALALAVLPPLVLGGGWGVWVSRALTFLVISCPCALVISIPLSFFGGIGGASRCGILKGGNYLEALAHTDTVVFDKTGTLTQGTFRVSRLRPAAGVAENDLLETAALPRAIPPTRSAGACGKRCPPNPTPAAPPMRRRSRGAAWPPGWTAAACWPATPN